jgi:hypothetical protein
MALPEGLTSLLAKSNPLEARLQEMLRATMERYASQALDTLAISRGVRELLSMHNIGQRLFAKFVLGLSQGTVSELLSKPKPWDKLTEKGRDSYRKMHAWACDEAAILLLKSLIPRKGRKKTKSFDFSLSFYLEKCQIFLFLFARRHFLGRVDQHPRASLMRPNGQSLIINQRSC